MKHEWERASLCLWCGKWCPNCNDCVCAGKGWKNYKISECPNFDTKAGRLRPERKPTEH